MWLHRWVILCFRFRSLARICNSTRLWCGIYSSVNEYCLERMYKLMQVLESMHGHLFGSGIENEIIGTGVKDWAWSLLFIELRISADYRKSSAQAISANFETWLETFDELPIILQSCVYFRLTWTYLFIPNFSSDIYDWLRWTGFVHSPCILSLCLLFSSLGPHFAISDIGHLFLLYMSNGFCVWPFFFFFFLHCVSQ